MLGYELIHVNERGPWSNMVVLLKTDGDGVRVSDGVDPQYKMNRDISVNTDTGAS